MVDVPCLDYLGDSQKDCPGNKQIIWSKRETTRNMLHCMALEALWQSCHAWITKRIICRVVLAMIDHITWPGGCRSIAPVCGELDSEGE